MVPRRPKRFPAGFPLVSRRFPPIHSGFQLAPPPPVYSRPRVGGGGAGSPPTQSYPTAPPVSHCPSGSPAPQRPPQVSHWPPAGPPYSQQFRTCAPPVPYGGKPVPHRPIGYRPVSQRPPAFSSRLPAAPVAAGRAPTGPAPPPPAAVSHRRPPPMRPPAGFPAAPHRFPQNNTYPESQNIARYLQTARNKLQLGEIPHPLRAQVSLLNAPLGPKNKSPRLEDTPNPKTWTRDNRGFRVFCIPLRGPVSLFGRRK